MNIKKVRMIMALLIGMVFLSACGGHKVEIQKFDDLGKDGIKIAIGEPEAVPAGKYSMKILDNLEKKDSVLREKIEENIITKEPNVRAVLDKVANKEVDAGFVYLTDAYSAKDDVDIIKIPEDISITPQYPIGILKESDDRELAELFVDYVLSEDGVKILEKHGFSPLVENPKKFAPVSYQGETLIVYAAISMTEAFEEIAANLKELTGADIRFKFGASGTLRQLIESGAVGGQSGADVFASANMQHMEALKEDGFVEDFIPFIENKVVIVVPK